MMVNVMAAWANTCYITYMPSTADTFLHQHLKLTIHLLPQITADQLNKLLCKSNQFGANEGKCYGSLGKYLLHNVHAFNSRYLPTSTP